MSHQFPIFWNRPLRAGTGLHPGSERTGRTGGSHHRLGQFGCPLRRRSGGPAVGSAGHHGSGQSSLPGRFAAPPATPGQGWNPGFRRCHFSAILFPGRYYGRRAYPADSGVRFLSIRIIIVLFSFYVSREAVAAGHLFSALTAGQARYVLQPNQPDGYPPGWFGCLCSLRSVIICLILPFQTRIFLGQIL